MLQCLRSAAARKAGTQGSLSDLHCAVCAAASWLAASTLPSHTKLLGECSSTFPMKFSAAGANPGKRSGRLGSLLPVSAQALLKHYITLHSPLNECKPIRSHLERLIGRVGVYVLTTFHPSVLEHLHFAVSCYTCILLFSCAVSTCVCRAMLCCYAVASSLCIESVTKANRRHVLHYTGLHCVLCCAVQQGC